MGLIMPGYPIANVCFKVYGYMSMSQAVAFLSDFKLGHYMKIPPKSMFLVQVINESPQHIVLLSELLTCIKETKVTNLQVLYLLSLLVLSWLAQSTLGQRGGFSAPSRTSARIHSHQTAHGHALVTVCSSMHQSSGALSARGACLGQLGTTAPSTGFSSLAPQAQLLYTLSTGYSPTRRGYH